MFVENVKHLVFKLLYQDSIEPNSLISIFSRIDQLVQVASDAQLVQILSYLDHSDGSALPFSSGLFHPRPEIQVAAARIILRLFVQKVMFTNIRWGLSI